MATIKTAVSALCGDHVQAMADVANLGEISRRLYNHIEAEI